MSGGSPTIADVILDDADRHLLDERGWYVAQRNGTWYARASGGPSPRPYLHQLILPVAAPLEVDHVNGNGLDNRRENLRAVTKAQNGANRHRQKRGRTLPLGVYLTRSGRYQARLVRDYKIICIGTFGTVAAAVAAREQLKRERGE